jgi:hypothetical protein
VHLLVCSDWWIFEMHGATIEILLCLTETYKFIIVFQKCYVLTDFICACQVDWHNGVTSPKNGASLMMSNFITYTVHKTKSILGLIE